MGSVRGAIRDRQKATQVRDFSGLRFGAITPTDLDGLIEYRDKGYVLIETKFRQAELPRGQRLALERLCDDLQRLKPTLLVVSSHDSEADIDVAAAPVTEFRFKGQWRQRDTTTAELIQAFIGHLDGVF